jgi:BioD-like phosphotransacetylase family protein
MNDPPRPFFDTKERVLDAVHNQENNELLIILRSILQFKPASLLELNYKIASH